jgi:hypothetical protein
MNKEQTAIELLRELYQCVDKTVPELAWMAGAMQNKEKWVSTGLDELGKVLDEVEDYLISIRSQTWEISARHQRSSDPNISEEAHLMSEMNMLKMLINNTPTDQVIELGSLACRLNKVSDELELLRAKPNDA